MEAWLATGQHTSPMTGEPLTTTMLFPNRLLAASLGAGELLLPNQLGPCPCPLALATNGTVRLARGFASIT